MKLQSSSQQESSGLLPFEQAGNQQKHSASGIQAGLCSGLDKILTHPYLMASAAPEQNALTSLYYFVPLCIPETAAVCSEQWQTPSEHKSSN